VLPPHSDRWQQGSDHAAPKRVKFTPDVQLIATVSVSGPVLCLLGGTRRHRPATGLGLLYPQDRTSATADAMSASGHKLTSNLAARRLNGAAKIDAQSSLEADRCLTSTLGLAECVLKNDFVTSEGKKVASSCRDRLSARISRHKVPLE
jgi:hypothetical protein